MNRDFSEIKSSFIPVYPVIPVNFFLDENGFENYSKMFCSAKQHIEIL